MFIRPVPKVKGVEAEWSKGVDNELRKQLSKRSEFKSPWEQHVSAVLNLRKKILLA